MTDEMQGCIENCQDCHQACLEMLAYCLHKGGKHTEPAHLTLLFDCAEICQTSANFMIRGSEMHHQTCAACAEICARCAAECEQLDPSDAQLQACAAICRRCADSCRQMAAAV